MQATLLPLFPIPVVVFPRTQLPLHIFEDRYKEMVGEALRAHTEFGIVLARGGRMVNAGCTVVVERVLKEYPDGRFDVVTSGVRRFEIILLNEERAFLRGQVEYFDDEDATSSPEPLIQQALAQYREWQKAGAPDTFGDAKLDDSQLSFQIADGVEDLDFRQRLLATRSEVERLRQVADYLAGYLPRHRTSTRMKKLAPTNGHGPIPEDA
jgi:ATP-dependent Lon protease